MTIPYRGDCTCGAVSLEITLPKPIDTYTPRACDCSYCTPRSAAYLSDPSGAVQIWAPSESGLCKERQGSETATMLLCAACNGLLGAVCEIDGRLLGAVNIRALERYTAVPPAQTVHLSELDADTKVQRWSDLWMPFQVDVLAA
jgi:hypothetical protein